VGGGDGPRRSGSQAGQGCQTHDVGPGGLGQEILAHIKHAHRISECGFAPSFNIYLSCFILFFSFYRSNNEKQKIKQ
jgi:hypothetical protein